jgi:uncharacterized protein YbjQ (UPF0145 family)
MKMIVSNIAYLPNQEVDEILGIVKGTCFPFEIRAMRNQGFTISFDPSHFSKLLWDTREEAQRRMVHQAINLGADAIVNVRFETSMVSENTPEVLVYGTAVKIKQ